MIPVSNQLHYRSPIHCVSPPILEIIFSQDVPRDTAFMMSKVVATPMHIFTDFEEIR